MGTYHFMSVGKAVGAVTCAVDYIEKSLDALSANKANDDIKELFSGSGGINHNETDRGKIEALVLFSSKEVIDGTLTAFEYNGCERPGSVREEIESQLRKVWQRVDPDEGRKVFWVEVDIDDYQDCFRKALKVAYRFSPPGKQGKEIWLNLTGGSNAIGLSLISMGRLTGKATKHYLISQAKAYQKHIDVPSEVTIQPNKDGYFNTLPFIKLAVDTVNFYEVLLVLGDCEKPVSTKDIFSRACSKRSIFSEMGIERFKRDYLLRLFGLGYTDYDAEHDLTTITQAGRDFINDLHALEAALDLEDELAQQDTDIVALSKKWQWLHPTELKGR